MLVSRNLFSLFNFSPHVRVRVTMFPHSIAQHHYTDILKKKEREFPCGYTLAAVAAGRMTDCRTTADVSV